MRMCGIGGDMLRRAIKGFTKVFKPPVNWNEDSNGRCGDLHVRLVADGNTPCCESAWEPTPDELAVLNDGGSIILRIWGGQPPVALYVETQDQRADAGPAVMP